MRFNKSQKEVLIHCTTAQEAQNLADCLESIEDDKLDDVLRSIPLLKEEIKELKKDNRKLVSDNLELVEYKNIKESESKNKVESLKAIETEQAKKHLKKK